jgi:antitoxin (DNA-binding transcriptional repressor) of toxin-antitoxin stability system
MRKKLIVPATEAAKGFGALVDRVRETGAVYQVESRGQVVAQIGPARRRATLGDLRDFAKRGPRAPAELLDAIEETRAASRAEPASGSRRLSGRGGRPHRPRR